jgi:hypothetical protein
MATSKHAAAVNGTGHALTREGTVGEFLLHLGWRQACSLAGFPSLVRETANKLDGEIPAGRF